MIGTGIGLGLSGYRLAPAGFSPFSISGLQLWLDASDGSTLYQSSGGSLATFDGDTIGQWRDKSGNSRHLLQADGLKKPQLKTSIQNARNVVRFDGTSDAMKLGTGYTIGSVYTVFAVAVRRTGGDASYSYMMDGQAANSACGFLMYFGGSGQPFAFGNGGGWIIGSAVSVGGAVCAAGVSNGTSSLLVQNGTTYTSGSAAGASQTILTLGNTGAGTDRYFSGDFCEVIFYNSALSSTSYNQVLSYLNEKWSVY